MRRTNSFSWQITALALIALGLGLLILPDDLSDPLRRTARDLSSPGQTLTSYVAGWSRAGWQVVEAWQARRSELVQLQAALELERDWNAKFQQSLARMQQELNESQRKCAEKLSANPTDSLFIPKLIEARVIGRETVALHASRKILGIGSAKGVGENLLVVDAKYSTLDVGKDQGLAIHAPVFAGQIVVGRTVNCGGYSCSLQPVTDSQFVGSGQLMRGTATGLRPGPEGVVEGTGHKRCRLTGIWRRASVEIGDEVYTSAEDPLIPHPMYYGKVVRADLPEGASHWTIELEPAANDMRLKHVHILKPTDNPLRVLAN